MEKNIYKYLNKNDILKISLTTKHTHIINGKIYLHYSISKNSNTLQIICNSGKYIIVEFDSIFNSYKNIDIIPHADEIIIPKIFDSETTITIIKKSVNLQKLIIDSPDILDRKLTNKLCKRQFLKYIKLELKRDSDLNDIYKIIEMKSLDTLHLKIFHDSKKILNILYYVVSHLNKYIKIRIDDICDDLRLCEQRNFIKHNFYRYGNIFIFYYSLPIFTKFNNFYDLNLWYTPRT